MGALQKFRNWRQERTEQRDHALKGNDLTNLRLFDWEMRYFYKRAQALDTGIVKLRKQTGQKISENAKLWVENKHLELVECAKLLVETYEHDQREKERGRRYPQFIFEQRDDLAEYYDSMRESMVIRTGRHWKLLNAAALGLLFIRKGKDAVWTLSVASGIAASEFIVRNARLDRRQENALLGWKTAYEYANNKVSINWGESKTSDATKRQDSKKKSNEIGWQTAD